MHLIAPFLVASIMAIASPPYLQCQADPTGMADSGPAFRACLANRPSGTLFIPAGHYKISGTLTLNRNQGLLGEGAKSSILNCSSPTSPCIVVADANFGPNNYSITRIENLGLEGPGTKNASIGVYLGGDPAGRFSPPNAFADSINLVNARITQFNRGIQWGNNAYVDKITASAIFANEIALFVPANLSNSGEAIGLTQTDIFNNFSNGIEDHTGFEWQIENCSFDYNATAIQFYGAHITISHSHFEQPTAQVFFQPYGNAQLSLRDSVILVQAQSGNEKYIFNTWPQVLNLVLDNVSVWSNHPIQYLIRIQGTVNGVVTNLYGNGNHKISAFSETSKTPNLTTPNIF